MSNIEPETLRKVSKRKTAVHKTEDELPKTPMLKDPALDDGDTPLDEFALPEAPPRVFKQQKNILLKEIFEIYTMIFMSLLKVPIHEKGSMATIQMKEDYVRMLSDGAARHFPELDKDVIQDNE